MSDLVVAFVVAVALAVTATRLSAVRCVSSNVANSWLGWSLFPTDEDRRFVSRLVGEMKPTLVGIAAAVSGLFVVTGADDTSYARPLGMAAGFVGVLILLRVTIGHGRRRD